MISNNINPKPYLIGETAYNHEGDYDYLVKMVDDIADLGLNAVKFHLLLNPDSYMQKQHPLKKVISKWLFKEDQWLKIFELSRDRNLDVIALCDDVESIEFVKDLTSKASIELHSTSLNDYYMLQSLIDYEGTIYLGVGGSTLDEINESVDFFKNNGKAKLILMYGFQSYPTDYNQINLAKMKKLKDMFDLQVGYADHTAYDDPYNEIISAMPAAMGFNILEKHYTPDFGKERIDYHAAVGKEKLIKIKELVEIALTAHGNKSLGMSKPELSYGNTGPMKKAIVAKKTIHQGEQLSTENLWFKRTQEESSVKQIDFAKIVGLKALCDINEDEIIDFTKVEYEYISAVESDFTKLEEEKK